MQPAKPGELLRDELGRIIVSHSSLKTVRNCPKKYRYRYIDHLVPLDVRPGDPRHLGKAVHGAREMIWGNHSPDPWLLRFWGSVDVHELFEERERSRAMIRGYDKRWWHAEMQADQVCETILIEKRFTGDIVDPRTSEVHDKYAAGGKSDGVVRVVRPCLWGDTPVEPGTYVYELKTSYRIDGIYIAKLRTDDQIIWYAHHYEQGLRQRGDLGPNEKLDGVLYDVIEKASSIDHTEAETDAEFEARRADMQERVQKGEVKRTPQGGTIKQRKDEGEADFLQRCIETGQHTVDALKQGQRESDASYAERLDKVYENPEKYHRQVVTIDPDHTVDVLIDVWETLKDHDEKLERGHWGRNKEHCYAFHRACDYRTICNDLENPTTIDQNYRIKAPHSEQTEKTLPIVQ